MYDYQKALIPYPQRIDDRGGFRCIAKEARPYYTLIIDKTENDVYLSAAEIIRNALSAVVMPVDDASMEQLPENDQAKTYEIRLTVHPSGGDRAEAYTIAIGDDCATLTGYDAAGAYYAAVTFAKLLSSENGYVYLPLTTIVDYPDFPDRGLFLEDRYGSDFMSLDDYKTAIPYLASMKYNQITVGLYGCWTYQYDNRIAEYLYIPFQSHPELRSPSSIKYYSVAERKWVYLGDVLPTMFADDYFGELIAFAKKHNIKVKPLFNSLGHNTLIPRLIPEISAKDENGNPTGRGYCTEHRETYDTLFELYDEIIDRYLTPNGIDAFEIGLDEVDPEYFCKCELCRDIPPVERMLRFIIKLCRHLKDKGMKHIYIYHDMLMHFDVINEETYRRFADAGIADVVVIDWWSYQRDEELFDGKELSSIFRGIIKPFNGYYFWMLPMEYNDSIYGCAKRAKKYGFEGIESYAGFDYSLDRPFRYQADLSWNTSTLENREFFYDRYAYAFCPADYEAAKAALHATRTIMEALLTPNYMRNLEYYWFSYKGLTGPDYPSNFPGDMYRRILNDESLYLPYLQNVAAEAKKAIDFFQSNILSDAFMNDTWRTVAAHYYNYASIYLTTYELYQSNAKKDDVRTAFRSMLDKHERFMLLCEKSRMKANLYTYQRNHSITRQWMLDVLCYCETVSEDAFQFDITDFRYLKSDVFYAIR